MKQILTILIGLLVIAMVTPTSSENVGAEDTTALGDPLCDIEISPESSPQGESLGEGDGCHGDGGSRQAYTLYVYAEGTTHYVEISPVFTLNGEGVYDHVFVAFNPGGTICLSSTGCVTYDGYCWVDILVLVGKVTAVVNQIGEGWALVEGNYGDVQTC